MKELLKVLPLILSNFGIVVRLLKMLPMILLGLSVVGAIGYGVYYYITNSTDPYKCFNGEIYEKMTFDSNVYQFKGGYCVNLKD